MYDLHAVDIPAGQFVHRHHIFGIMVLNLQKIGNLPIGFLWQPAAYLDVDALVASHRYKINFFCPVLSGIKLIPPLLVKRAHFAREAPAG